MPNPNAIVSSVIRFEPPLDRVPADILTTNPDLSVELEGQRRVRFDPENPRSVGYIQILVGLSQQRLPVYLEIDPQRTVITRLLIPLMTRVEDVLPSAKGGFDVQLQLSHARHTLSSDTPDFAEMEGQLREALNSQLAILVSEDDAHNILDVRLYTPGTDSPPIPPPYPKPGFPVYKPGSLAWLLQLLKRIWLWRWWPWWWFGCVSVTRAQQIFDAMNATSCNPLTVPAPCITFMYPDDGCWGRAHEMYRLISNMGVLAKKVWIEKNMAILHANTKNNPACFVEWYWHVAPTICVHGPGLFQVQDMVIDPSLFTTPVSKAMWKSVQGDPSATLTATAGTDFYWGATDPTYTQTNTVLATYRLKLQNRALTVGAPPYAYCP